MLAGRLQARLAEQVWQRERERERRERKREITNAPHNKVTHLAVLVGR